MTGTTDRDYLRGNENIPQNTVTPPQFPNLWLVSVIASYDDIVVRLFTSEKEAIVFCKHNPPFPFDSGKNSSTLQNAFEVHPGGDVSAVVGIRIVRLVKGVPQKDNQWSFFWSDDESESAWSVPTGWHVPESVIQPMKC